MKNQKRLVEIIVNFIKTIKKLKIFLELKQRYKLIFDYTLQKMKTKIE